MLKISWEATANILQKLLNDSLETGTFPDSLKLAIEWFENNHMKLNQEKCHLLV